jgi:hypothetical protein
MAKCLSWAAILLATMTVVLWWIAADAEPGSDGSVVTLSLYAGLLALIVAVAGLLLAKRGGKRAPRLARVALAFGIGVFSGQLLLFAPLFICPGGLC